MAHMALLALIFWKKDLKCEFSDSEHAIRPNFLHPAA